MLEALAASIVSSFLLPYLKLGADALGRAVADKAGKAVGDEVESAAGKLWGRVKEAFSSEGERATLEVVEAKPVESQALLESLLLDKLESDPALVRDLEEILDTKSPETGDSPRGIVQRADVAGVLIVRDSDFRGAQDFQLAVNIVNQERRPRDEGSR